MELSAGEKMKLAGNYYLLQTMEDITGVPALLLAARWYLTSKFKLAGTSLDGPFGADSDRWTSTAVHNALHRYPRLTLQDTKRYAKKPSKDFFINGLLAATELKETAPFALYPDMSERAALVALEAFYIAKGKVLPEDRAFIRAVFEATKEYVVNELPKERLGRV